MRSSGRPGCCAACSLIWDAEELGLLVEIAERVGGLVRGRIGGVREVRDVARARIRAAADGSRSWDRPWSCRRSDAAAPASSSTPRLRGRRSPNPWGSRLDSGCGQAVRCSIRYLPAASTAVEDGAGRRGQDLGRGLRRTDDALGRRLDHARHGADGGLDLVRHRRRGLPQPIGAQQAPRPPRPSATHSAASAVASADRDRGVAHRLTDVADLLDERDPARRSRRPHRAARPPAPGSPVESPPLRPTAVGASDGTSRTSFVRSVGANSSIGSR